MILKFLKQLFCFPHHYKQELSPFDDEWLEYKELPVCKSEVFTDMLSCKEDWVHGMTWEVSRNVDESNV